MTQVLGDAGTREFRRGGGRPPIDINKLFDRLPPHSPEAEMSLLGSMILDPQVIGDVLTFVDKAEAFYEEKHAAIFRALIAVYERHQSGDLVEVVEALRDAGRLDESGGPDYLVRLAESVPSAANATHYARIVSEKYRLRRLIDAAGRILYDAFHAGQLGPEGAREVIDVAEMAVFEVAHESDRSDPQRLADLLHAEIERLEKADGRAISGLPTGFPDLDRLLSGLQAGEMIVVAGRPSMGKCLAADSEIVLGDGSVLTIAEVVRRQAGPVATLRDDLKIDWQRPTAFVNDGVKPTFEVRTRLGRRIVTTLTHPFLTMKGWVRLEDLAAGARIAVPRRLEVFGRDEARECEVRLLAYLIGDGGLTGTLPRFTNSNPRIADDFADAVHAFGGLRLVRSELREGRAPSWSIAKDDATIAESRHRFGGRLAAVLAERGVTSRAAAAHLGVSPATLTHWTQGKTSPRPGVVLRLCEFLEVRPELLCPAGADRMQRSLPNPLTRWLRALRLMGQGAAGKHVPAPVFTWRRELVALFLNRLFATDGWATVLASGQAQLGYATVSERLGRQVQHLLLRFGVVASLRQRWVRYRDARRVSWQLDITDARSILTFADSIGIFGKEEALAAAVEAVKARRYQTNRDLVPVEVWGLLAAAKGSMSWRELADRAGVNASNLHVGTRALSRERLGRFARVLGDPTLLHLAQSGVYWDEIVSIEPAGMGQVYDLTIPGTHNFIANDVCVHNTALALNLAEQIALGGGGPHAHPVGPRVPVGVFSLEMTKSSVVQRLLSAYSGIDSHRLRNGQVAANEWTKLDAAAMALSEAPIFIDDMPNLSVLALRARARRMVAQHQVRAIMVDYLQLLSAPAQARESRQVEVSAISRGLKALAHELKLPIICLAQLNRAAESREGNRPRMSDLRESGSIEQDADVVVLIHREDYYHLNDREWQEANADRIGVTELIVAKQRNGPTGVVELMWNPHITRFVSYDARSHAPPPGPAGSRFGGEEDDPFAPPRRPPPPREAEDDAGDIPI